MPGKTYSASFVFIINSPVSPLRHSPTVFIGFKICIHFIVFGSLALSSLKALALSGGCWTSNEALVKGSARNAARYAPGELKWRPAFTCCARYGPRNAGEDFCHNWSKEQVSPSRELNLWLEDVVRESSRRSAKSFLFFLTSKNFF